MVPLCFFNLNSLLQLDLGELGHLVKLELPYLASRNIGCLVKVEINIEWFIRISMSPILHALPRIFLVLPLRVVCLGTSPVPGNEGS